MSKKAVAIIIILVLAIAGGLAVWWFMRDDEPVVSSSAPKGTKDINPLTGLEMPKGAMKRPFVVSTGNDSYLARPQAGLSNADILYEVPIEGGGSRYEPIYYSQTPGLVGEIRSTRPYIINIAREYNAVLVHNGQSPQAKEIFDTIDRIACADFFKIFHHEDNPNLPGNFYSDGKLIVDTMKKEKFYKEQDLRTFPWLEEGEEAEGGKEATEIHVNYYDGSFNTFKYDPETKLYTKYVKDEVLIDANNNKEITCANILVQEVPFQMYDEQSQRLDIDMTKGGTATMFTQGKVVKGKWSRTDLDSPTVFTNKDGNEFKMTPGVTWIQLIDDTVKFEYQ